jgi:putative CocE/NonD family hydrolase
MTTSSSSEADPQYAAVHPLSPRRSYQGQQTPRRTRGDTTLPLGDPTGGVSARIWRAQVDGELEHPRVHIDRNVEIRMSDGVRLRATVVRPADRRGRPVARPYPAVLNLNPYNRAIVDLIDEATHAAVLGAALKHLSSPLTGGTVDLSGGLLQAFGINRRLVRSGYVQVIVDVRGTGASPGVWQILGSREQQDTLETLEWAGKQPWCTGDLGIGGWSYSAINSLQAAGQNPPGLKAVFAVEGSEDIVRDIYLTGGLPSAFIPCWLGVVNALKWLPNPRTLARDALNGTLLRWLGSRLTSPATEVGNVVRGVLTGNDPRLHDNPYFAERNPRIESITAPTFLFGGWHDLFARSTPRIYSRLALAPGEKQMLITDGYHFDMGAGFGGKQAPPRIDVLQRAWFDRWLKGEDNGADRYGPITVHQQGGQWTTDTVFPRPEAQPVRLYATAERSGTAPGSRFDGGLALAPGRARRAVPTHPDLRGFLSPELTQVTAGLTKAVPLLRRAGLQERGALSFTSPLACAPVRLSGAMNVHLVTRCGGAEAIWTVTVNDVGPDGGSTVLSNGALTATFRALDDARCEWESGELMTAVHPLTAETRVPVRPGDTVELDIEVVATEVLLEEGHRLRVDVYAGSFPRFLATVPDLLRLRGARQELCLAPDRPSYLSVRIAGDPGW